MITKHNILQNHVVLIIIMILFFNKDANNSQTVDQPPQDLLVMSGFVMNLCLRSYIQRV